MAEEKSVAKDRGALLEVLILLSFLSIIYFVYETLTDFNSMLQLANRIGPWYMPFLFASRVGELTSLYGLWNYKKWGAYLFIFVSLLWLIVTPFIPGYRATTHFEQLVLPYIYGFSLILSLLYTALFIWAISRKWSLFD